MSDFENIGDMYDMISSRFDVSRVRIWNNVQKFLIKSNDKKTLLDAGCGNGKNAIYAINNNYDVFGIDISEKLLKISADKNIQVCKKNILEIDYENVFDKCICIAVIHHLDTIQKQCKAITNLIKSLKTNGELLISVWSYEKTNIFDDTDNMNEKYRTFVVGKNKINWTHTSGEVIKRDYYIHDYTSFLSLINMVEKEIKIIYIITWEKQNWFCKIIKL